MDPGVKDAMPLVVHNPKTRERHCDSEFGRIARVFATGLDRPLWRKSGRGKANRFLRFRAETQSRFDTTYVAKNVLQCCTVGLLRQGKQRSVQLSCGRTKGVGRVIVASMALHRG